MNRSHSPSAAFAFITTIGGIEYKLLRHHQLDSVQDGNEHNTVDQTLLTMALRMVDQLPANTEEKEKVREHLQAHAEAIRAEMTEDRARKIVESTDEGPDGNHTLTDPKVDMEYPNIQDTVVRKDAGAATAAGTPTKPGKDNSPNSPKGDVQHEQDVNLMDDPDKSAKTGKGEPVHAPKVSEPPIDSRVPTVHEAGDTDSVGSTGDVEAKGAGTPPTPDRSVEVPDTTKPTVDLNEHKDVTSKSDVESKASKGTPTKPGKDNSPDGIKGDTKDTVEMLPKGDVETPPTAGTGKPSDKPKVSETGPQTKVPTVDKNEHTVVPKKGESKVKAGDWVRSKDGIVGVVTAVNNDGKATVRIPSGRKTTAGGWKVIVRANEVNANDSADLLQKEMRILNSPEALEQFATPTPEGQRARKNHVALACVDDLTSEGRKFVIQRFVDAVNGKAVAKIQGVDKLGSVEFVDLKIGESEEFPFYVMMEIMKDGDDKVRAIRILNECLPHDTFKDLAKFLKELAAQAPEPKDKTMAKKVCDKAKEGKDEKKGKDGWKKTEAPAKLDRCVKDVMTKKLADFRKKNKREPNKKERQKMESSAFAICNAQLKKGN